MTDLLVRTRVAVAKRNLSRISELAAMIVRSEFAMNEFLNLPDASREQLATLLKNLRTLKADATDYENTDPDLWTGLTNLENGLSAEVRNLNMSAEHAQLLRAGFVTTPAARRDIATHLVMGANELANVLTEETYWKQRERIEGLFNEYVDLLRGIALRNAGFGDAEVGINELFAIADRLPSLWPAVEGWAWQSMAVPSRTERRGSTEAMVLRVGFPEWTMWALPLIQHEFGYVFLKKKGLLPSGSSSVEAAGLADALATLVTGPAYACAVLLLRLNPALVTLEPAPATSTPQLGAVAGAVGAAAVEQPSEVAMRSAAILAAMRGGAQGDASLALLATRLETEWRNAITNTGGSVEAFDLATAAPATGQTVELARQAVLQPGPNDSRLPPYWAAAWPIITAWADRLTDEAAVINLSELTNLSKDDRPLDVAGLLNAAWLARVRPTAEADATDSELDKAAAAAIRLLRPDTSSGRSKVGQRLGAQ